MDKQARAQARRIAIARAAAVTEIEALAFERGAWATVLAIERAIENGTPPINAVAIVKGQLAEERPMEAAV